MNQTKKRLAIIKLAISMTDTETIQLQILKLGMLKTDDKLKNILTLLEEKSYARAQKLISEYIETTSDITVLQRTSQDESVDKPSTTVVMTKPVKKAETPSPTALHEKIQSAKDQAIIDEFDLFIEDPETEPKEIDINDVNYDDFLDIAPTPKKMSSQTVNYDSLLNVDAEDVLSDNIQLDISTSKEDTFFKEQPKQPSAIERDTFFDDHKETITLKEDNPTITDTLSYEKHSQENFLKESTRTQDNTDMTTREQTTQLKEDVVTEPLPKKEETSNSYRAITYIDQKFKNLQGQYPMIEKTQESFASVDAWLLKVGNEGYTEKEVEEIIKHIEKLTPSHKAEAAQLLLITGATESKYAQFRLARALYQGELLKKNLPEAFTLINRLALNDSYPEAICDLAQFYENGIGIEKDKKKAQELYKEAMESGIHRAIAHYDRIQKENKGFLSAFKR